MAGGNSEIPCGYDEDFVSPIDEDLQCSICYLALREPILTRCGHRFCRACLERHMARFVFQICQAFFVISILMLLLALGINARKKGFHFCIDD